MFNKSYYSENHTHVHVTERVTEEKAPTDESIRLLNEFQEKAKNNIILQMHVEDNTLNGVVIFYCEEYGFFKSGGLWPDFTAEVKFKINGKEHHFSETISGKELEYHPDLRRYAVGLLQTKFVIVLNKYLGEFIKAELEKSMQDATARYYISDNFKTQQNEPTPKAESSISLDKK